ncbi:11261_t:CDS:2 [Gigaspora margarita]|uniref:11261_t:CDS:1 n=1 Tax=Gigaspora margarita TaxID=4874 RepID=A0ABN7UUF1_GIGMA|nr:11261_t:CDS:2 [Gigaspora margarita]
MNEEQFNKFMEALTKSVSKEKMIPKESNLVKIKYFYGDELRNLKKSIEGLTVNYATLSVQIKDTRTYRLKYGKCEETGHIAKKCMSEKEYPYRNLKKKKITEEQDIIVENPTIIKNPLPSNNLKRK